jgi:hypothetical protein
MTPQRPIIITGAARSGTSLTAGIIQACGAWGGETLGGNRDNKRGFFENQVIREQFLKPLLELAGADPLGQDPLPRISDVPEVRIRREIHRVIAEQGYRSGPWYFKAVKACLIWPLWVDNFPDAAWVIVERRDADVIASCMKTGFMKAYQTKEGWAKWLAVYRERCTQLQRDDRTNTMTVSPAKFLTGDYTEIRSVIRRLGLTWNKAAVEAFAEPELFGGLPHGR